MQEYTMSYDSNTTERGKDRAGGGDSDDGGAEAVDKSGNPCKDSRHTFGGATTAVVVGAAAAAAAGVVVVVVGGGVVVVAGGSGGSGGRPVSFGVSSVAAEFESGGAAAAVAVKAIG